MDVKISDPIVFYDKDQNELIKISHDNKFYVRGVELKQDKNEAFNMHTAFIEFLYNIRIPIFKFERMDKIMEIFEAVNPSERMDILSQINHSFCKYCGSTHPNMGRCNCQNK